MQFINIVVHSVEDMNFRVHLQYDFTKLNLDEHLEVWWSHDLLSVTYNTLTGIVSRSLLHQSQEAWC